MSTVLWVFIALAIGFMMFVSLQPELPEGLSWLKNLGGKTATSAYILKDGSYEIEGWKVVKQGTAVELTKQLESVDPMYQGPVPIIGMMCSGSPVINTRLDTKAPLAEGRIKGTVSVVVGGLKRPMQWYPAQGTNVLAEKSTGLVDVFSRSKEVQLSVTYANGPVLVKLDTSSFNKVSPYFGNCTAVQQNMGQGTSQPKQ